MADKQEQEMSAPREFTLQEAAIGYALTAERIYSGDVNFLNSNNQSIVPIFVSQLFQSLEISIKYVGRETNVLREDEAKSKIKDKEKKKRCIFNYDLITNYSKGAEKCHMLGNGHWVEAIAKLIAKRLEVNLYDFAKAMTCFNYCSVRNGYGNGNPIYPIHTMICGNDFIETRKCYASRRLAYIEIANGDFSLYNNIPFWIEAVKETANNLDKVIKIFSGWQKISPKTEKFETWLIKYPKTLEE
ncbi:MAG: hypothetical protein A2X49_11615 [Lentisphaerae bacterium GWF2_52_8]|nr:MAG: hypothetical protein A2X49_11615 [Lentisphaerae bacterium GWF2_52_8]